MVEEMMAEEDFYIEVSRKASFIYERIRQLSILLYLDESKKEGKRVAIEKEIHDIGKYKDEMLSLAEFNSDIYKNAVSLMKQIELISNYLLVSEYKKVHEHLQNVRVLKESMFNITISKIEW